MCEADCGSAVGKAKVATLRSLLLHRSYRRARAVFIRPLGPSGKRRLGILLAGLLALITWQRGFAVEPRRLDESFKITAASGVFSDRNFVYFLYYLNLFPVTSSANICKADTDPGCWDTAGTPAPYNHDAAKEFLVRRGATLKQDIGWTWNAGDRGKIYLYLFDAWLKGAPWNPSPIPASRLIFITSLALLYSACWWIRRPLLGALLVLFLGSNPFQIYEVHANENVFGLNISVAILVLASHIPLLRRWKLLDPRSIFLWPLAIGVLMASVRTMRSEPVPMMISAAGTYVLLDQLSKKRRLALVGVLVASFLLTSSLWNWHFLSQHRRAAQVVAAASGHPFPREPRLYHHVWHPIWCGLGDFDTKHGYEWNDFAAAAWAKPHLEAKGIYVPNGTFEGTDPREFFDPDTRVYKKLPYDLPEYNDLIREKILGDIRSDPLWYLMILMKRVGRVFTDTTPLRITWPQGFLTLPWHAALTIPLLFVLGLARSRFFLGVCLFTMPNVTSALVVFSGRGMTYYGVFHIVAWAIVVNIFLAHGMHWIRRHPSTEDRR